MKTVHFTTCFFLLLGASIKIDLVWNLCDILNGMMALPNLVSLWLLAWVVRDRSMHSISLDYLMAAGATRGKLGWDEAHPMSSRRDPEILDKARCPLTDGQINFLLTGAFVPCQNV
jgi:hypothetical protein